jgi:hypothetical protein
MWEAVGLAIGQWLTDAQINLERPIRSLSRDQLMGMGWAAVRTYVDLRLSKEREIASTATDPNQLELPV